MKKFIIYLLASGIFYACGISSSLMKATVVAGIAQTQTAVVVFAASPTPLPFTPTALPTPQPTLEPITLGGKEQLLLQIAKCSPPDNPNCSIAPLGIYLAQVDGNQQNTVADQAILVGVAPDGERVLIQPLAAEVPLPTLVLLNIKEQKQSKLSASFSADYPCDDARCSAVWLKDDKRIAFITKTKNANFMDEKNIFIINDDGSGLNQITRLGSDTPPMYLYQAFSAERIYWEKDGGGIMGGTFSIKADGSELSELQLGLEVAFSPDGEHIAFQKKANELGYLTALFVASKDGNNPIQVITPQNGDSIKSYIWSPDGTRLVFDVATCQPDCITKRYMWQQSVSQPQELALPPGFSLNPPTWTPNGKFLLFVMYNSEQKQYAYWASNVETGQVQPILNNINLPLGVFVATIAALP